MEKLRFVTPFFLVIPLITGYHYWQASVVERERASLVQPAPQELTCAEFSKTDVFPNRHISITEAAFGDTFVYQQHSRSPEFQSVLIPLYSWDYEDDAQGKNIHLVARLNHVRDQAELKAALDRDNLTGCVWADDSIASDKWQILKEDYPQIDPTRIRILDVGRPLPTLSGADTEAFKSSLAFALAIGAGVFMLAVFLMRVLGMVTDTAKVDPYDVMPEDEATAIAARGTPSKFAKLAENMGNNLLGLAVLGGVIPIILMKLGMVSTKTAMPYMTIAVLVTMGIASLIMLIPKRFEESLHIKLSRDALSSAARDYFDEKTPEMFALGFRLLGDFQPKPGSTHVFRRFLSFDGRCASSLASGPQKQVPCFMSMTSDGVFHETTSTSLTAFQGAKLPWQIHEATGSIRDVFEAHNAELDLYTSNHDVMAWPIHQEELFAVIDLGNRLAAWAIYMRGFCNARPPSLPQFSSLAELNGLRQLRLNQDAKLAQANA